MPIGVLTPGLFVQVGCASVGCTCALSFGREVWVALGLGLVRVKDLQTTGMYRCPMCGAGGTSALKRAPVFMEAVVALVTAHNKNLYVDPEVKWCGVATGGVPGTLNLFHLGVDPRTHVGIVALPLTVLRSGAVPLTPEGGVDVKAPGVAATLLRLAQAQCSDLTRSRMHTAVSL